jgi:hypothetical protein
VLLAAVSSFLLGGLWYSPALCGRIWNAESGGQKQTGHPATVLGVSFGLVAASFGVNYQFAQRSFKPWLIDGGYHTVQFSLFGLVLGLWH